MNLVHRRAKQANSKISKSTSMASNSREMVIMTLNFELESVKSFIGGSVKQLLNRTVYKLKSSNH